MSIEVVAEPELEEKAFVATPVPDSWWGKLLYGLFVVVMPVFAFWATDLFKPDWQTGQFSDYLILLLFPEASLLFFLLLAYSIISYCLLLIDSVRYSQMPVIRSGIYTGLLLALQYSVLSGLFFLGELNNVLSVFYLITTWLFPVFSPKVYRFLVNKWGVKTVNTVAVTLVTVIFLISTLLVSSPLLPFVLVLAGLTLAAPFWCLLMMVRAAIWLWKKYESKVSLPQGLGIAAWVAGYVAAWRFDILKMYELYAALPPQPPPDCYIATAAARGHPKFVGSWHVERMNGEMMQVNQQLQILKCAELALMAFHPRFHKMFRRVYNVVGKALAKRIQHPLLADLAYLLLRPCDLLARCILRLIVPQIDLISNQMYTS